MDGPSGNDTSDGSGFDLTVPTNPNPTFPLPPLRKLDDPNIVLFLVGIILPHAFCTFFVVSRIISRLWVIRKWFIDDTLIVLAWLFSTALCVVYSITAETPSLLLAPNEATLQKDTNPYIMRTYLGLIYYQVCLSLTKLSILSFYLRIFVSRPKERRLAWGTITFVLLYSIPMMLMSSLQCYPVKGQFFGKPMLCFGFPELLISSASLHSATDLWLIVMVIPCVIKLDLPKRQKVALGLVMSLGIFVIAASMVRLQLSLHRHYRPNSEGATNTLTFFVMTMLECDLALICASAPTLRPLLGKVFPAFLKATKRMSMNPDALRSDSFDLTSLTYEGYPWGNPGGPQPRSKDGSVVSHLNNPRMPPPVPPLPMSQKTKAPPPPPLNLKGAVLGSSPRLGGAPLTGDGRPMLGEVWEARRTSSIYSTDHPYSTDHHYSMDNPYDQNSDYSPKHIPTHLETPLPKTMRLSLGPGIGTSESFMTEARNLTNHSNRASASFVCEGKDFDDNNYNRASTSFMNEGQDFTGDHYNRASTSYASEGKASTDDYYNRASTSFTSGGKDSTEDHYNRASTSFASEGNNLTSQQNRASTSFANEGNNLTVGYQNRYSTSYITEPNGRHNRLSSMSGLSGATYTVGRFAGSARDDSRRLTMDIPQERDRRIPPPRPKRPDDPTL